MAGIDKTYVTKKQLIEAVDWCTQIGEVLLENTYKFKPIEFIIYHDLNEIKNLQDDKKYVLWNTPIWFDRWLWLNCPLEFVKNRIKETYSTQTIENFENYVYKPFKIEKHKYKFIEVPSGKCIKYFMSKGNKHNPFKNTNQSIYEVRIVPIAFNFEIDYLYEYLYNKQTKTFGNDFLFPYEDKYIWQEHHKRIPNKKSILRQIRKWNIPSNCLIHFENVIYKGLDFKILVK